MSVVDSPADDLGLDAAEVSNMSCEGVEDC